jgi:hypothetical protein
VSDSTSQTPAAAPDSGGIDQTVARIERLNYIFGGLAVIASALLLSRSNALGVAVGVALCCGNFLVLRRVVTRWVRPGANASSGLIVMPKMLGLMAAVVLCLWLLPISGLGLAIGYSIFIPSMVVEGIRQFTDPPADSDANGGTDGGTPS